MTEIKLETKFELLTDNELSEAQGGSVVVTLVLFGMGAGAGYIGTTKVIDAVHKNWTRQW